MCRMFYFAVYYNAYAQMYYSQRQQHFIIILTLRYSSLVASCLLVVVFRYVFVGGGDERGCGCGCVYGWVGGCTCACVCLCLLKVVDKLYTNTRKLIQWGSWIRVLKTFLKMKKFSTCKTKLMSSTWPNVRYLMQQNRKLSCISTP